MSKVFSVRVSDETAEWLEGYAQERGVKTSELQTAAIESFRKDCESGVPELRRLARQQSSVTLEDLQGVGDCPGRPGELGHRWLMGDDMVKRCRHCPMLGRDFLNQASQDRVELFSMLRMPESAHGKAKAK